MNLDTFVIACVGVGLVFVVGGFSTLIAYDSPNNKNKKYYILSTLAIVVGVLVFIGGLSTVNTWLDKLPIQSENYTTTQDIYSATVPYGIISSYGSGWRYYYSQNYAEIYNIKVMSGNEVLTYSYKTSECRVIVDGTFQLEQMYIRYYKIDPFDGSRMWCNSKGYYGGYTSDAWVSWKPIIHIPEMPTPQNTITDWYVGG